MNKPGTSQVQARYNPGASQVQPRIDELYTSFTAYPVISPYKGSLGIKGGGAGGTADLAVRRNHAGEEGVAFVLRQGGEEVLSLS